MARLMLIAALVCCCSLAGCNQESAKPSSTESNRNSTVAGNELAVQMVEVSCGQCQFGMQGAGCDLAVRIDGKSYFVEGSSIDDHGDAHGEDGLCNCIRKARVAGAIKDGRFVATSIGVLPNDKQAEDGSDADK